MDVVASLVAPCPPETLFGLVEDLDRYPEFLEIVTRAERVEDGSWAVDLRGRLGPLARSKRLRMVRTRHEPIVAVTYERVELDSRTHSGWVLEVDVTTDPHGSALRMALHYDGKLFAPVVERVLRDEIEQARGRLLDLVGSGSTGPESA